MFIWKLGGRPPTTSIYLSRALSPLCRPASYSQRTTYPCQAWSLFSLLKHFSFSILTSSWHSISFSLSNANSSSLRVPTWPQSNSALLFLSSSSTTLFELFLASVQMTHRFSILKPPFILSLLRVFRGHLTYAHCSWVSYLEPWSLIHHRQWDRRAFAQSTIPTTFPQLLPSIQQLTGDF